MRLSRNGTTFLGTPATFSFLETRSWWDDIMLVGVQTARFGSTLTRRRCAPRASWFTRYQGIWDLDSSPPFHLLFRFNNVLPPFMRVSYYVTIGIFFSSTSFTGFSRGNRSWDGLAQTASFSILSRFFPVHGFLAGKLISYLCNPTGNSVSPYRTTRTSE